MANAAIERSALGRVAHVGDLYDAYSECFTGISILKQEPPQSTVRVTDNHSSNIEYVFSDSFSDKCDKLNIEAELKVSLLAGLIQLGGSGKYLQDEKRSAKAVRSSLIYNVQTQVEHINLFAAELKDCFALDALNVSQATHVVVEVRWGANSTVTMEYANEENHDVKEIKGSLQAVLNKLAVTVKGEANVVYGTKENINRESFSLRTFADVLPTGELPQTFEGALDMMKKMPEYLKASNDGKGKPLSYLLLPLSELKDYLSLANIADKTLKMIDEQAIIRFVTLFDDFSKEKQILYDLHEDMKKRQMCLTEEELLSVGKTITDLNAAEAQLKAQFAKILISIRSGEAGAEQLETLRHEFEDGPLSLQNITQVTNGHSRIKEKMAFTDLLEKEGVVFVGRGASFETIQMEHMDEDIYVLFYSDTQKVSDPRWSDHINMFLNLVKSEKSDLIPDDDSPNVTQPHSFFVVIDVDLRPDLELKNADMSSIKLCLWRKGNYVDTDVVKSIKAKQLLGYVRCTQNIEVVNTLPNKRVVLTICCPGSISGTCPHTKMTWFCYKCEELTEYGFDGYFYCKCGGNARAKISDFSFRCNDPKHGLNFLSFSPEALVIYLGQLEPIEDCMNILILGETGVGKSTWINGIANYMSFATLEEARTNDLISLIGASFTVMDEDFQQKVITVGDNSNEDLKVGQSATQDPKAYVFHWNDKMVRLIDTPGIGDTRGIDQDKANFDAILRFLSELQELHGICILLKPNNARLGVMFKFCVKELLTHLHRSCSQNIVFCFTNARNTFYKPGDTFPALKKLLSDNKDVEIDLSKHTIYCMDNESFRYLCMIHNGVKDDEFDLYSKSWDRSVAETNRLLQHIQYLKPHTIKDTISLNDTRRIIISMTKPIADISQNIEANITVVEDKKKEIESSTETMEGLKEKLYMPVIDLEAFPLDHPRTVCTSSKCVKYITIDGTHVQKTEYVTHCHTSCGLSGVKPESYPNAELKGCYAMDENYNCRVCGCSWSKHMHITYDQKQISVQVLDISIEALINLKVTDKEVVEAYVKKLIARQLQLQEEQSIIRSACVKFGNFLANNAMLPYNDALAEYLDVLIKQEKDKCAAGGDKRALEGLEKMRKEYAEEVKALKESIENDEKAVDCLSVQEIKNLVEELYSLPLKGAELKQHMEVALESRSRMITYNEVHHTPPPNSSAYKSWWKRQTEKVNKWFSF